MIAAENEPHAMEVMEEKSPKEIYNRSKIRLRLLRLAILADTIPLFVISGLCANRRYISGEASVVLSGLAVASSIIIFIVLLRRQLPSSRMLSLSTFLSSLSLFGAVLSFFICIGSGDLGSGEGLVTVHFIMWIAYISLEAVATFMLHCIKPNILIMLTEKASSVIVNKRRHREDGIPVVQNDEWSAD